MEDHLVLQVCTLATTLMGICLIGAAADYRDGELRRHSHQERASASSLNGRQNNSDDRDSYRIRRPEQRTRSLSGRGNHFGDDGSESAHSRQTARSVPIPSENRSIFRPSGSRVYDRRPAGISIIEDDRSIPEDPQEDGISISRSSAEQLPEHGSLAENNLFRNGGGDQGDRTPSRPSIPVQETQIQTHQRPHQYRRWPVYKYDPLPSSGELIRLIQLHAGEGEDELRCRIFKREFSSLRPGRGGYEAISYVWQISKAKKEVEPSYPLVCDDCPVSEVDGSRGPRVVWMHQSADTVLRRFRLPKKDVILWIDAICLNQKDENEKHYQIKHMKDIYGKADQVLVWLDESPLKPENQDSEDGETLGEKCIRFFNEYGKWKNKCEKPPSLKEETTALQDQLSNAFNIQNASKLAVFFKGIDWFHRRWIIQEITHAQRALIYCGRKCVAWPEFAASIKTLSSNATSRRQFEGREETALDVLDKIQVLKDPNSQEQYIFNILHALDFFHTSDCEHPLDRIVALLPISRDESHYEAFYYGLRYESQKEVIYHKFAYFNLTKSNSLDLLHCAGAYRPKNNTAPCIASWVPDWECKPRFSSFLKVKKFNTGGSISFFNIRSDHGYQGNSSSSDPVRGHSLVVRGFIAGTIQDIQTRAIVSKPRLEDFYRYLKQWSILAGCEELDLISSAPSREAKALAITLIADQGLSESSLPQPGETFRERPKEQDRKQQIDAWRGFRNLFRTYDNPSLHADAEERRKYHERLKETTRGRRLFRTYSGQLGIGPDDIRAGDRIAVLYGGRTPFILRPFHVVGVQDSEKYFCELIGDCYIHNMMDDKLMQKHHERERIFWIM